MLSVEAASVDVHAAAQRHHQAEEHRGRYVSQRDGPRTQQPGASVPGDVSSL